MESLDRTETRDFSISMTGQDAAVASQFGSVFGRTVESSRTVAVGQLDS